MRFWIDLSIGIAEDHDAAAFIVVIVLAEEQIDLAIAVDIPEDGKSLSPAHIGSGAQVEGISIHGGAGSRKGAVE